MISIPLLLLACLAPEAPEAPDDPHAEPVRPVDPGDAAAAYLVRLDAPRHRVIVEATVPTAGAPTIELWMPTWTPGSYLIREYARNIETLAVFGPDGEGAEPSVRKITKNRWAVQTAGADPVTLRYTLYAREMSVRSNFVDAELALLNGAPTFLVPGDGDAPLDVRFESPDGWTVHTALPRHPDGTDGHYLAPDLDALVDSPVLLGTPDVRTFTVADTEHHLVTLGEAGPWDHARAVEGVEAVVREQIRFWGTAPPPYPSYRFLNVLGEAGGGLEHRDSTLMLTSRYHTVKEEDFHRWLGLVSHEFFHTWNVKRFRPEGLGPFDYESEVYTRSLWVAEGVTSYYDDLLLRRADLLDDDGYLERLSRNIERLHQTPGRLVTPLSETSFDAWIEYYRRDENTANHTVSYYTKGAVVAWLLDAELRRHSGGAASLDTLMRRAYRELPDGYTPEQFRALASDEATVDLTRFFDRAVDSAEELDYLPALAWWGLRFHPTDDGEDEDGYTEPTPGWHGAKTRSQGGRLVVSAVPRDTPAWRAGLNVDDELVAFDGHRLTPGNHSERLAVLGAGTSGTLLISRRGLLRELELSLEEAPDDSWKLEPDPDASAAAVARRRAWLGLTSGP